MRTILRKLPSTLATWPLVLIATPALAQSPATALTADQKGYIVYDRCMLDAAMKASYGFSRETEIFDMARRACSAVRTSVTAGQEGNTAYLAALDAADAEKAKNFPSWIRGVRERRRLREAQTEKP